MILAGMRLARAPDRNFISIFSLAFMVPLMLITALDLWNRRPQAYLYAGILLVTTGFISLSIISGNILTLLNRYWIDFRWESFILFTLYTAGTGFFICGYFKNMKEEKLRKGRLPGYLK